MADPSVYVSLVVSPHGDASWRASATATRRSGLYAQVERFGGTPTKAAAAAAGAAVKALADKESR